MFFRPVRMGAVCGLSALGAALMKSSHSPYTLAGGSFGAGCGLAALSGAPLETDIGLLVTTMARAVVMHTVHWRSITLK